MHYPYYDEFTKMDMVEEADRNLKWSLDEGNFKFLLQGILVGIEMLHLIKFKKPSRDSVFFLWHKQQQVL